MTSPLQRVEAHIVRTACSRYALVTDWQAGGCRAGTEKVLLSTGTKFQVLVLVQMWTVPNPNGNILLMGCQSTKHHAYSYTFTYSFTPRGNLEWSVHLPAYFWGVWWKRRKRTQTHTWQVHWDSNWAQDQSVKPGAVKRQRYPLCHRTVKLIVISIQTPPSF